MSNFNDDAIGREGAMRIFEMHDHIGRPTPQPPSRFSADTPARNGFSSAVTVSQAEGAGVTVSQVERAREVLWEALPTVETVEVDFGIRPNILCQAIRHALALLEGKDG